MFLCHFVLPRAPTKARQRVQQRERDCVLGSCVDVNDAVVGVWLNRSATTQIRTVEQKSSILRQLLLHSSIFQPFAFGTFRLLFACKTTLIAVGVGVGISLSAAAGVISTMISTERLRRRYRCGCCYPLVFAKKLKTSGFLAFGERVRNIFERSATHQPIGSAVDVNISRSLMSPEIFGIQPSLHQLATRR